MKEYMSDFEQCLNRLQLYLMLFLVNFSYELGILITRYDFLDVSKICDFEKCLNQLALELISRLVSFINLGK